LQAADAAAGRYIAGAMKRFPIFRPGKHTATSGAALEFSADQLKAAVAAYDPALHEAPIVVGHPKDNHPAFGWVGGLSFNEETGEIEADPAQVDPAFAELVQAGRFKKRSASWYLPDAPNNPKPGSLYLRHVGFLGAMPPAVKGLRDVAFSDSEAGVIEFGDSSRFAFSSIAAIMRGLREWIIGKDGLEAADKLVPNYYLTDLEAAAKAPEDNPPAMLPAFSEEDPMKIEQLQAENEALKAENETLKANQKPADFSERETSLAAREAAVAAQELEAQRRGVEARVDAAVKDGRVVPKQKKAVVDFAMALDDREAVIEFGEGEKAEKVGRREAYLRQVEASPKVVSYGEAAPPTGGGLPSGDASDPAAVAKKARDLIAAADQAGSPISFTEAVAQATAELSAE
jgi:hypothetical protein